jgi:hypothetical protein
MDNLEDLLTYYSVVCDRKSSKSIKTLDGGYFEQVLSDYEGPLGTPIYIKIIKSMTQNDAGEWGYQRDTTVRQEKDITRPKIGYPYVARVVIEIKEKFPSGEMEMAFVHSNLIIIDSNGKPDSKGRNLGNIYRFDPQEQHGYHNYIDTALKGYFAKKTVLSGYNYSLLKIHPQKSMSKESRIRSARRAKWLVLKAKWEEGENQDDLRKEMDKIRAEWARDQLYDMKSEESVSEMCVAYVIKAAVQYVLYKPISFPEDAEADIKCFASEIVRLYKKPMISDPEGAKWVYTGGKWVDPDDLTRWGRFKNAVGL